MKTIALYRHMPQRFDELLRPAREALTPLLRGGPLHLDVAATGLSIPEGTVWATEGGDDPPARMFRAGLRRLTLHPGMTSAELTALAVVLLPGNHEGPADLVSDLFDAELTHVTHAVTQGFDVPGAEAGEVAAAVEETARRVMAARRSGRASPEEIGLAEALQRELGTPLEATPTPGGSAAPGADPSTVGRKVRAELERDEQERVAPLLARFLVEQLATGRIDGSAAVDLLVPLVDRMLADGAMQALAALLDSLSARGPAPTGSEARRALGRALAAPVRLNAVGLALRNRAPELTAIARYLGLLGAEAVPPMLEMLAGLDEPDARALVIEAIAGASDGDGSGVAARLASSDPRTVRDALEVLGRIDASTHARDVERTLRHPVAAVRVAALTVLGGGAFGRSALRGVIAATSDAAEAVRIAAFRAWAALGGREAAQEIIRRADQPGWLKASRAEREASFECLGRADPATALTYASRVLEQPRRALFGGKQVEAKLLVLHALRGVPSADCLPLLREVAAAHDMEAEVAAAAGEAEQIARRRVSEDARRQQACAAAVSTTPLRSALEVLKATRATSTTGSR